MEHSKTGFIISITRGFVAIVPAVLLLSYIFGMTGVWLSFPMAEIFALFSGIFTPFVPVMAGAGVLRGIVNHIY